MLQQADELLQFQMAICSASENQQLVQELEYASLAAINKKFQFADLSDTEAIVIKSENYQSFLYGVIALRKMFFDDVISPADINLDIIQNLLKGTQLSEFPRLQAECLYCIANITSGPSRNIDQLINYGGIQKLTLNLQV